jgi:crotonobetainyl-CoA:carnitine CoA-transferase CaiB-like acyl-CoA transferase
MPVAALKDITVIECSTYVTGPYATMLLGDLGARVIKVESPPDGDPYRYFAPDPAFSPNFTHLNRNKESLVLDLKTEKGKNICRDLAKRADVFVENFRPGAAGRLGLGFETLKSLNTKLVYCSISAYGQSGPSAGKPGFDTLGQAASGLLSVLADPDQPRVMGVALSDYVTGLSAAYGILGALLARQQSGEGVRVETSLLQATLSFIGETAAGYLRTGTIPDRAARVKNAHAFAFLAKDKLPLVIHCSVPEKFWLALLKTVERMDLAQDKRFRNREERRRNYDALERELSAVFATRTRAEWINRLEDNDVPAWALYNIAEALEDEQVKHLNMIEEVEHRKAGKLKFVGSSVNYSNLSRKKGLPPPLLGEQTKKILSELGIQEEEILRLESEGVVQALKG